MLVQYRQPQTHPMLRKIAVTFRLCGWIGFWAQLTMVFLSGLVLLLAMFVGVAKFELGDKQGAILDYDFPTGTLRDRAVTIDPEDSFAYYNRGVARFELGDKQGAILDFDRAITIDPQDAESYTPADW
jgi:tetratricopeptide (TPR) repeat protein